MTLTGPDDPRHGTWNGYSNHGCRCGACKEGRRVYMSAYVGTHPGYLESRRLYVSDWRARRKAGLA